MAWKPGEDLCLGGNSSWELRCHPLLLGGSGPEPETGLHLPQGRGCVLCQLQGPLSVTASVSSTPPAMFTEVDMTYSQSGIWPGIHTCWGPGEVA